MRSVLRVVASVAVLLALAWIALAVLTASTLGGVWP